MTAANDNRIETLTPGQSLQLLATATLGRVVFTDHALPAVLPVTFTLDGGSVVLRTAAGSRLARAAHRAVLAFEADELDPVTRTGWSVVVTGQSEVETDPGEQRRLEALLAPWVPGRRSVLIRIPATVVTGRRVSRLPAGARHALADG